MQTPNLGQTPRVLAIIACVGFYCVGLKPASAQQQIDFARDVRPILSENCSFCHGPDEEQREAGLRLDTQEGAWSVIKKGQSGQSEIIHRVTSSDDDSLMPPPNSNRQLNTRQIEILREWIDQGAKWEQHWSFRPVEKPPIPTLADPGSTPVHNPIDAFVQKRLETSKLAPSKSADRETLARRLCLDLTGLPPTIDQVNQFLNDKSADAYEKFVDRLLESDAFGERMAWDWLDAARYADTNGYQGDGERTMWPWRDWVVDAFNDNLPYDQFTLWQLAGDLLPEATHEQKLATAFNRNHMINGEGGRIAEENRVEYVMDMTETMGTVWLGMTLNCCRCHDHKYDPIKNNEYYQLFSFFNQTSVNGGGGNAQTPPILASPTMQQRKNVEQFESERTERINERITREDQLAKIQADWEKITIQELEKTETWVPLETENVSARNSEIEELPDGSLLVRPSDPESPPINDTYKIISGVANRKTDQTIAALRLDVLRHKTFADSLSHADSGNFVLTEINLRIVDEKGSPTREASEVISSSEASFEQGSLVIEASYDGDPKSGWAVYQGGRVSKDHAALYRFDPPLKLRPTERLEITLSHDSVHEKHNIGRFLLSSTTDPSLELGNSNSDLLLALKTEPTARSKEQLDLIQASHRNGDQRYQSLIDQVTELDKKLKQNRDSWPKVMVMEDQPKTRKTYLLERGLYNQPKQEVVSGFPTSLLEAAPTTVPEHQSADRLTRLDLAKWLVHPDHPLTSRVTVNRFWQQFFGTGLVKTTEDFGTQGETPVHLDLLNWLARDFIDNQWNVKAFVRLLVTSHTYRQSSKIPSSESYELDPENRLLSRAPRYRLPAWMIRDQALAVSGLLSPVRDGPAVNTYQPPGIWEEASFGKKKYRQDTGEKLYRRSLYVFWRRIIAPTMFFDSASRQTCTVRSGRTNTPLHALQTLNGVTYVESARQLAQHILAEKIDQPSDQASGDNDRERIHRILQRVIARRASQDEQAILERGLERARKQFAQEPDAAIAFLSVGQSARDETIDASELAAWTSLCLAVLNFDETLNRE